ncbi:hypothetical protein AB0K60_30500 [Thermopolyspora sp. NPDC052614]|uniref:hypothetical protein n=1 Tax=Thermopolyspora sp. NPDC052614 TaxID=3155682 RepID=UPI003437BCD4
MSTLTAESTNARDSCRSSGTDVLTAVLVGYKAGCLGAAGRPSARHCTSLHMIAGRL